MPTESVTTIPETAVFSGDKCPLYYHFVHFSLTMEKMTLLKHVGGSGALHWTYSSLILHATANSVQEKNSIKITVSPFIEHTIVKYQTLSCGQGMVNNTLKTLNMNYCFASPNED